MHHKLLAASVSVAASAAAAAAKDSVSLWLAPDWGSHCACGSSLAAKLTVKNSIAWLVWLLLIRLILAVLT